MKKINFGRVLKSAGIILVVLSLIAMSFIGIIGTSVHDAYALEESHEVEVVAKEKVKVDPVEKIEAKRVVDEHKSVEEVAKELEKRKEAEAKKKKVRDTVVKEPTIAGAKTIEEKIKVACDIHNVPYNIAMAIARLETGHFKSNAYKNKNNPGGLSRNEKPMSFDTINDGVEAFISNLSRNYIKKGLTTPEKIGKKYCPVNYNHWVKSVKNLM